ncbi:MAG: MBL fold metallo-hydrolase [Candidatus Colwellbacteria bacterium]|nr:MBL fold metallo-hydrolase [Candidatus Colwellbacteria bacterium]
MKLTFCGGARSVTGANYLLETEDGKRAIVDCGLYQSAQFCEPNNREPFSYDPRGVDAAFITHAHIDHIGRLPFLYKLGFRGRVYSTPPTRGLAEPMLLDAMHLMVREAEDEKREPLYTGDDVQGILSLWESVSYRKPFEAAGVRVELFDAGHIIGSASFLFTWSDARTGEAKRILFSGDLGNVAAPLVKDTEETPEAEYAVMESVYGDREHADLLARKELLEDAIEDTVLRGGALLIPAFALERTQELLYEIGDLVERGRVPKAPVFVDSPLAIKILKVYGEYACDPAYFDEEAIALCKEGKAALAFPGVTMTETVEESKAINDVPSPKVIIAGSGMSNGGRIIHHERRHVSDPKNMLLFVGYQASGSLGRRILDGARSVRILGEEVAVNCQIRSIEGYSAHADRTKLVAWARPIRNTAQKIFVVQGEEGPSEALATKLRDELAIEAVVPMPGESVEL